MSFTLRKLRSLPSGTRLRKITLLLQAMEEDHRHGRGVDGAYLRGLFELVLEDGRLSGGRTCRAGELLDGLAAGDSVLRAANGLRHLILSELGTEPAEWDLIHPDSGDLDAGARQVFDARVYLEDVRSPYNVGAVFRAAESFGVREILLSTDTPSPAHPRAVRTSRGTTGSIPWRRAGIQELAGERELFVLETGGIEIDKYRFPLRGTVVLGSEELGVSPQAVRLADERGGRVSIPSAGAKRSLNVAVAFGIMMERWFETLRAASDG